MRFNGSIPYTPIGLEGWPRFGFEKNDRWQFSNDLTWVKGRHTLKTGFEFRHHNFPSQRLGAGRRGRQLQFQSARHGRVRRQRQQPAGDGRPVRLVPPRPGARRRIRTSPSMPTFSETYTGIWVNDEFKVSDKLTLTLGHALRLPVGPHRGGRISTPRSIRRTPNPGAGGIPGAIIFAGEGPGRAGTRKFEDVPKDAWGPRAGFAYRLERQGRVPRRLRHLLRARRRSASSAVSRRRGSRRTRSRRTLTNGLEPAFHLDAGFPQDRIQFPPFIDPSDQPRRVAVAVAPDGLTLPALPELVGDVPAQAHRQHDAGRVVHRQSRQPPEPPLGRRSAWTPT